MFIGQFQIILLVIPSSHGAILLLVVFKWLSNSSKYDKLYLRLDKIMKILISIDTKNFKDSNTIHMKTLEGGKKKLYFAIEVYEITNIILRSI